MEPSKEWDEKKPGPSEDGSKIAVKEDEENHTPGVSRIMRNVAIREKDPGGLGTRMLKAMRCPASNCCKTLKNWFCEGCFAPVEFSLDGWCRCVCGEYRISDALFRCNSRRHYFLSKVAVKSDAKEYSLLGLQSDLQLPTQQMSNLNTVDLQSFFFNVSSLNPVHRLDVMRRAGRQETIELIMGLVDICKPLLKSININLKFHEDGSIRHKRAFVQTYNTSERNFVHELGDVVKLEGEQGYELSFGDWRVDIFVVKDPLQPEDGLDVNQLLQERREIWHHLQQLNDLLNADCPMAGSSYGQLHTICGSLVAGRYCREVVEYFKSRAQGPMHTSSGEVTMSTTEPVENPMERR